MKPAAVALAALAALAAQYFLLIRPWFRTWGAEREEVTATLPGDAAWPGAADVETRAITIRAPPERVWPWVAQIGQDRGGFYSYRWLENLVGCEMPEDRRLLGLRDPRPGEKFWMYPPGKAGGKGYATYLDVERPRAIVLATQGLAPPDDAHPERSRGTQGGSWSMVLLPRDGGASTRLIVRGRAGREGEPVGAGMWAFQALFFEPIHFAMERRMLLGIRDRAEGRAFEPPWRDAAEVVLWMAAFGVGLAALALVAIRWREAWRPLCAGTAALFVLTALFFARPPLGAGIALVGGAAWALGWSATSSSRRRAGL
jgi:uncharacterized protein YndB with AHSA1/START domain